MTHCFSSCASLTCALVWGKGHGGVGGGGGKTKSNKTWFSWQLDPASRRADRFLLFNPMKRLILQTNRISRPAVHYMGREKAQLALETIHRFLSQSHARESFAGDGSHSKPFGLFIYLFFFMSCCSHSTSEAATSKSNYW